MGGVSVQQLCAVHLAKLHGKAPGLRERRAAKGRWQHHLSSAGGRADLCPLGRRSHVEGLQSPAAASAKPSKRSSPVPHDSNPTPVRAQESCHLQRPSTMADGLTGSSAVSR